MVPEKLIKTAEETKSLLCFGVDPILSRMGQESPDADAKEEILSYFPPIIDALLEENVISAIKPNYAYFAAEGFEGLHALKELISRYKSKTFVILDAKRGDIGKSSEAYARECYDFWGADAVTVSPYMGQDSVSPFVREGKLTYLLGRTSNGGAKDFEELESREGRFYESVFRKAKEWGTGLVVGATSDAIPKAVELAGEDVPLLIPGIGSQGGSFETLTALRKNPFIHRVNSSSAISYAHEKRGGSPESAAIAEARETCSRINSRVF
ncbi:orotidine-5'-phosphate decarboxylase [Candidatus Micrarchaeota archaeon]|nr:orotidine-5'-phosphate decarboxylase [Candidatus Micrarchaeota archaeon]